MSQFITSKNKIKKIWNDVESNKNQIDKKSNQDKIDFFTNLSKQQNIKVPVEIYNSGDIVLTSPSGAVTAIKGEKMPSILSYSQNIDLEIPENLLPFVKHSIEVTPIQGTEVHTMYKYDPSTWVGDNIKVEGDGILIYKGHPNIKSWIYTNFPTQWFSNNGISLSLSKIRWQMRFDLSSEAPYGSCRGGIVGRISSTEGTIESGETIKFGISHYNNKDHEIRTLTTNLFRGVGDEITTTYDGEGEIISQVTVSDVTRTRYFAQADAYTISIISDSYWSGFEEEYLNKQHIDSITLAEKWNRWLFWKSDSKSISNWGLFGTIIGDKEGDFAEVDLPLFSQDFNTVKLKRNLEPYNTKPTIQYDSRGDPDQKSLAISSRNFKNYVKISESTAPIPTYRFKLDGDFIISSPSTAKKIIRMSNAGIETQEFEKKSDKWYALINENESNKLSGTVQNIYHKKTRSGGSITTEFFTDPVNNSKHVITNLTSTTFTAVGNETTTVIPINPDYPPIIIKRNNIMVINELFNSYDDWEVTYCIDILDSVDFPVYNDVYKRIEGGYQRTEDHEMLSKEVLRPESQNIILNIKAYLINPLYWREQRKYNKNDF